jgi:hypothetical protein
VITFSGAPNFMVPVSIGTGPNTKDMLVGLSGDKCRASWAVCFLAVVVI